ncbi:hypothetical protein WG66_004554, partial [Moniliophthora roreri]
MRQNYVAPTQTLSDNKLTVRWSRRGKQKNGPTWTP